MATSSLPPLCLTGDVLTRVEQAVTDAGRSFLARHVQLPFEDIMASVFADEVGWLADVVAARGMSINDGSGGER